jgi:histidinol-phosphate aminotransferase
MTTYKLSSNENPYPPLPGVVAAATAAAEQMNRYPDMGNTALYEALADKLGVPTEQLALATGSVALIYQLVQAFCDPGDEVVYAWRSFEAYPIAVTAAGARGIQVPVTADGRHDLEAMAEAITDRTRIVMVCTPNNPTGPSVTQAELDAFLGRVPEHVLVVVDEAYVEFVRMTDAVHGVATVRAHDNVISTRTFSKAYGLAGFRVGYAVAPAAVATALRAVSLPFGVSNVAQAAALASLRAEAELLERVDALVAERERVVKGLADVGLVVPEAQGNFVWFAAGDRTLDLAAAADELGIVIRPFAGDGARISIGESEANGRIVELARTFPLNH